MSDEKMRALNDLILAKMEPFQDDDPNPVTIVCMRVGDLAVPVVPSEKRLCDKCGAIVWMNKANLWMIGKNGNNIMCVQCAAEEAYDRPPDKVFMSKDNLERWKR